MGALQIPYSASTPAHGEIFSYSKTALVLTSTGISEKLTFPSINDEEIFNDIHNMGFRQPRRQKINAGTMPSTTNDLCRNESRSVEQL